MEEWVKRKGSDKGNWRGRERKGRGQGSDREDERVKESEDRKSVV